MVPPPSRKGLWRTPQWGCRCGEAENWASRDACRACGAKAPQKVLKAIEEAKKVPEAAEPRTPAGRWAAGKPQQSTNSPQVKKLQAELEQLKKQMAHMGTGAISTGDPGGSSSEACLVPLAVLADLVAKCKASGFPNLEAEKQLEDRKRKEAKPRTLETARAEARKAKHDFEQAHKHRCKLQGQLVEAEAKLQVQAEKLAAAEKAEREEVAKEHEAKVAPHEENKPAISLERLLAGSDEDIDIDCGSLFNLQGTDAQFNEEEKKELQSQVDAFLKEAVKAARQTFGDLAAKVSAEHAKVTDCRTRLAGKKRRVEEGGAEATAAEQPVKAVEGTPPPKVDATRDGVDPALAAGSRHAAGSTAMPTGGSSGAAKSDTARHAEALVREADRARSEQQAAEQRQEKLAGRK
jgi:hypothetical protein